MLCHLITHLISSTADLSGIHSNFKKNSAETTAEICAPTCGSEKTSSILFIGPYGKVAPSKTVNHSERLFSPILNDINSINRQSHAGLIQLQRRQPRIIAGKTGTQSEDSSRFNEPQQRFAETVVPGPRSISWNRLFANNCYHIISKIF